MSEVDHVNIIEPSLGDYVVFKTDTNKKLWGQVTKKVSSNETLSIEINQNLEEDEREIIESIEYKNILANLGSNPSTGSVFGQRIEILRKAQNSPLGRMLIFREMTKPEKSALVKGIKSCVKKMESKGWGNLLDSLDRFVVKDPKGRYAGLYKVDKNGITIELHPKEISLENCRYIVFHELGHHVWYKRLSDVKKGKWVELFNKYATINPVDEDSVIEEATSMFDSISITDYIDSVEPEYADICHSMLSTVCEYYSITYESLEQLHSLYKTQKKKQKWLDLFSSDVIKVVISTRDEHPISEYGSKKVEECFAEAFAFHMEGKKLPSEFQTLIEEI
jgi:hypothetical protein